MGKQILDEEIRYTDAIPIKGYFNYCKRNASKFDSKCRPTDSDVYFRELFLRTYNGVCFILPALFGILYAAKTGLESLAN